jgi:hypothetical protein
VKSTSWVRNPIDDFVLARLEASKLPPSPEADKRTLIRRLYFDLLGLPPGPEEVEDFLKDTAPDSYEKLVDRLLASPRYGERWARHWLDVARFGESDGFERDLPRFRAWPYRDWVINALNRDVPYPEFVTLQLAGDILRPGDPEALAATGFLVAGPHDVVVPVGQAMRDTMRQDELEDVIGTVAQSFLGLTVNCARCHDHKFDPIPQKDYYQLASALSGVGHGERALPSGGDADRMARLRLELERLHERIASLEREAKKAILAERGKKAVVLPAPLAEWDFRAGLADRRGGMSGQLHGSARLERDGLRLDGRGYATAPLKADLREKTLEAWVRLDNLTQRGGGVLGVQTPDGNSFDAIVFGEQEPGRWLAGSDFFRRSRPVGGAVEKEAVGKFVHVAITYAADGTITLYRDGAPYGRGYKSTGPVAFRAGTAQVVFGLRHAPAGGNKMLAGTISTARLYARALSPEEISLCSGSHVSEKEVADRLTPEEKKNWQEARAALVRVTGELRLLETRRNGKVYAVVPFQPAPTRVLQRGSVTAPGETVAPGVLSALSRFLEAESLPPNAPEGRRRLVLASWVGSANNPLLARVMVNRLWMHHFGSGLVETPNDFGFNGGRPSHPELLDWLACEFAEGGWSLKSMHRLLVTSAAYRQASAPRPEGLGADAGNRLLWRQAPRRLEAEAVRDAMLRVAGRLEESVGGAHYQDFRTYYFKGTQFYDPVEQVGPAFGRRTVYRMWARGGRSPFLDTFDCPDPSTTAPRRAATTTPLQALALLNNSLVLDLADALGRRAAGEAGPDVEKQIERVFLLAYGRPPLERERSAVTAFARRHGLAALARVVFNSNEFLQVD